MHANDHDDDRGHVFLLEYRELGPAWTALGLPWAVLPNPLLRWAAGLALAALLAMSVVGRLAG